MLLSVRKMTCNHCIRTVTQAVRTLDPEAKVEIDLADGSVWVQGAVTTEEVIEVIRAEGYAVQLIQP